MTYMFLFHIKDYVIFVLLRVLHPFAFNLVFGFGSLRGQFWICICSRVDMGLSHIFPEGHRQNISYVGPGMLLCETVDDWSFSSVRYR